MHAPETLQSDRLMMRRVIAADTDVIFSSYAQDPEVTRYLTWAPNEHISETKGFIARCVQVWDEGSALPWAIVLPETGRLIGMIEAGLDGHRVELGYVLAREAWGSGYATEAVRTVIEWAFSQPSIWRVWAYADIDNSASTRVLEKAGMQREGLLRRWGHHPNVSPEPRDCWSYSVCR